MQIPAKISFHNIDPSEALKVRIDQKLAKLNQRFPNIIGCQVLVESAHHRQQKGRLYTVKIDVRFPGNELVVSHHPGRNPVKHEEVYAAMNDAFAAIEKQLSRQIDMRRNVTKTHQSNLTEGVVSNYFKNDGYGFMSTIDGQEVYFHRNAVEDDRFENLDIGHRVRFIRAPSDGRKGPQASLVRTLTQK